MESKFKVGDLVTVDPDKIDRGTELYKTVGDVYKVVEITGGGRTMRINEQITSLQMFDGWIQDYWMITKNHIVTNILNDL